MAKQINYTKKNHVTCQIYTLLYVAVFFSSNSSQCRNWILNNLYIINTLRASSTYRGRVFISSLLCFISTKSNKLFVYDIYALFTFTFYIYISKNQCNTWNPKESSFKLTLGGGGGGGGGEGGAEVQEGRVREKWSINHTFCSSRSKAKRQTKEPHEVGLRGWMDSTSVAKCEKKYTWRVFISATD